GDWFWFFTSGEKCEMARKTAGYLVSIFQVLSCEANKGDDPPYSPTNYKYTIRADKSRCIWIATPLLVDEIIRPAGHGKREHIGNLLQGPRRLSEMAVSRLKTALEREGSDVIAQLID